jgi:hypothetical protein
MRDQPLLGFLGVTRSWERCSSTLRRRLSIQPKASASSAMSS